MAPPIKVTIVIRAVSEVKIEDVVSRQFLANSERTKTNPKISDTVDLAVDDAVHITVLAVCEESRSNGDTAEDAEVNAVLAALEADLTEADMAYDP